MDLLPDLRKLFGSFCHPVRSVRDRFRGTNSQSAPPEAPSAPTVDASSLLAVKAARDEWVSALDYFNDVTDPELIDHAILVMGAAERKYMYILKRACSDRTTRKNTST